MHGRHPIRMNLLTKIQRHPIRRGLVVVVAAFIVKIGGSVLGLWT